MPGLSRASPSSYQFPTLEVEIVLIDDRSLGFTTSRGFERWVQGDRAGTAWLSTAEPYSELLVGVVSVTACCF